MKLWHIQLHPNKLNDFPKSRIIKVLTDKKVIGLGEWPAGQNQINNFKNAMKIGDVVLVRGDGPIAIVKITSDAYVEPNVNEELDWFENRRKIEILAFYDEWSTKLPPVMGNAYWGVTLEICKSFKGSVYSRNYYLGDYIHHWLNLLQGIDDMDIIAGLKRICVEYRKAKSSQVFAGNELARFLTGDLKSSISSFINGYEDITCKASAGNGNWAEIPWISFLNKKITSSTQKGVYPVILFPTHGNGFYLSLNQGTSFDDPNLNRSEKEELQTLIKDKVYSEFKLTNWSKSALQLESGTSLGTSYESPSIYSKYYDVKSIDGKGFLQDLIEIIEVCNEIANKWGEYDKLFYFNINPIGGPVTENSKLPPFTILAGISGTGKSRFVKTQALLSNGLPEDSTTKIDNYSLISVRPDWHEPSDILGYVSRIDNKFHSTEFVEFLMKAWDEVFKFYNDIHLQNKNQAEGEPRSFWLCLDEMNLAPVEQFFADFLSVYESRKWSQGYFCEPLIKENVQLIKESIWTDMSDEFWTKFEDFGGIPIPPNLMVVGTVNMDETTHGFSRKVLDRAFSVDFAEFFPNDFDSFFGVSNSSMKALSYPTMTHLFQIDENGSKKYFGSKFDPTNLSVLSTAKDFLKLLNDQTLKSTPFEVGYRALDQLLLMVEYWYEGNKESLSDDNDKKWLASILDEFVMTKILPRVEGDIDKLGVKGQNSDTNILQVLKDFLNEHEIFKSITSEDSSRFDLFREKGDDPMEISCRSIVKIDWMISRLEKSGYTSFWI